MPGVYTRSVITPTPWQPATCRAVYLLVCWMQFQKAEAPLGGHHVQGTQANKHLSLALCWHPWCWLRIWCVVSGCVLTKLLQQLTGVKLMLPHCRALHGRMHCRLAASLLAACSTSCCISAPSWSVACYHPLWCHRCSMQWRVEIAFCRYGCPNVVAIPGLWLSQS